MESVNCFWTKFILAEDDETEHNIHPIKDVAPLTYSGKFSFEQEREITSVRDL